MGENWIIDTLIDLPTGGSLPVKVMVELEPETRQSLELIVLSTVSIITGGIVASVLINKLL